MAQHADNHEALLGTGFRGRSVLLSACVLPFTESHTSEVGTGVGTAAKGVPADNPLALAAKLFRSVIGSVTDPGLRKTLLLQPDDYGLTPLHAVSPPPACMQGIMRASVCGRCTLECIYWGALGPLLSLLPKFYA